MKRYVVVFACILALVGYGQGGDVYVSLQGDNTAGTSWATAWTSFDQAIVSATNGDRILFAPGLYETELPHADLMWKTLTLLGGFRGDEDPPVPPERDLEANITQLRLHQDVAGTGICTFDGFHFVQTSFRLPQYTLPFLKQARFSRCVFHAAGLNSSPVIFMYLYGRLDSLYVDQCTFLLEPDIEAIWWMDWSYWESHGPVHITNSTFVCKPGNAGAIGIGYHYHGNDILIENCTFSGLQTPDTPYIPEFTECNMFAPDPDDRWCRLNSRSCIFHYPGMANKVEYANFWGEPLFLNPGAHDYRLAAGSPCIDTATMGNVADYRGYARPIDIPGVGADDTGTEYDFGAWEMTLDEPTPVNTSTYAPTNTPTHTLTASPTSTSSNTATQTPSRTPTVTPTTPSGQSSTILNPRYDSNLEHWQTSQYEDLSRSSVGWSYATEGPSIAGPRSAPGMALIQWSGASPVRYTSIFQTITSTARAHTTYQVSVWAQCVSSQGMAELQLRCVNGIGDWNQAAPPGQLLADISSTAGQDSWHQLTGTFTPTGAVWQVGATWVADAANPPDGLVVAAVDDWSLEVTSACVYHDSDFDPQNWSINVIGAQLIIQRFNTGGAYHCGTPGNLDGFLPGTGQQSCNTHSADQDNNWIIDILEAQRVVQFFNVGSYHCQPGTVDGYAPGPQP